MTLFTPIALGGLFLKNRVVMNVRTDRWGGDARIDNRLRFALVAFGRPFIANPDLVGDLEGGHALTAPDSSTFYTAGEKGYTDY